MPRPLVFDRWLFVTTALLVIFGLLMVGSASFYLTLNRGEGPAPFLSKLVFHVVVALLGKEHLLRGHPPTPTGVALPPDLFDGITAGD